VTPDSKSLSACCRLSTRQFVIIKIAACYGKLRDGRALIIKDIRRLIQTYLPTPPAETGYLGAGQLPHCFRSPERRAHGRSTFGYRDDWMA